MNLEAIKALIQTDLDSTDRLIERQLNSTIPLINQLSQHIIHSGGKRLRPMLVLLSAKAFGYQGDKHITLAAIIELIHTATLLHDDVVDGSSLRRGKQTANDIWGNPASVLVGDYLYSRTFQMMVEIGAMPVMTLLSQATNTIAEGEVLQLLNRHNAHITEADYLQIISNKTGALFSVATQLGAVLSERSTVEIEAMTHFGLLLGMAFQIADDLMDYQAAADVIGKNIGDDLAEGKTTLPLIYALKHGNAEQRSLIEAAITQASTEKLPEILKVIESTGAMQYTYEIAQAKANQASQQLSIIPDSAYRNALLGLAQFAIKRHY